MSDRQPTNGNPDSDSTWNSVYANVALLSQNTVNITKKNKAIQYKTPTLQ